MRCRVRRFKREEVTRLKVVGKDRVLKTWKLRKLSEEPYDRPKNYGAIIESLWDYRRTTPMTEAHNYITLTEGDVTTVDKVLSHILTDLDQNDL